MKINSSYPSFTSVLPSLGEECLSGGNESIFKRTSTKTHAPASSLETALVVAAPPAMKGTVILNEFRRTFNMTTTLTSAPPTTNKHLLRWVDKMADLCQPDYVHWIDGSNAEYDHLCDQLIAAGN